MKTLLVYLLAALSLLLLGSWGYFPNFAIFEIALKHETKQAKSSFLVLTQGPMTYETYTDDQVLDPDHDSSVAWHNLVAPPNLNYEQFRRFVQTDTAPDIYNVLLKNIRILSQDDHPASPFEMIAGNKIKVAQSESLKWIGALVADIHQPMHISSAPNNGKELAVIYNGVKTNLYSLWENRLVVHQGIDPGRISQFYDTATDAEINEWQADDIIKWMFESYTISAQLVENAKKDPDPSEAYYQAELPLMQQRIDQAGIRLAGLLNTIFAKYPVTGPVTALTFDTRKPVEIPTIAPAEAFRHAGETVKVCGKLYGHSETGDVTQLYLGAPYPNQPVTVLMRHLAVNAADGLDGRQLCFTGKPINYRGKMVINILYKSYMEAQ